MKWKELGRRKINSIYELSEKQWELFEEHGLEHPQEMWEVDLVVEFDDPSIIPDDVLINSLVFSLEKGYYDAAESTKQELIRREYIIEIDIPEGKKIGTLTVKKK